MKLELQGGSRGNRGNLMGIEVTSKININKSIVPSVPSVPFIISRACGRAKTIGIHVISLSGSPTLCKNEGTEGTEGTKALQISVFRYPLSGKGTLRYPLPFILEGSL